MDHIKEICTYIKIMLSVILGGISALLGGFDMMLKVLVGLTCADYLLGVLASLVMQTTDSSIGFKGIVKKTAMFVVVGVAFSIDLIMETDLLRNTAIMFFIANEGISIIENSAKVGVPIPEFLHDSLLQLKDKGTSKE